MVPRRPRQAEDAARALRQHPAALAAASAPALAATQVPALSGLPLSIEYSPSRAVKLSGSTSLRRLRTGHTDGKGWRSALPGSSASHCVQADCRKAR